MPMTYVVRMSMLRETMIWIPPLIMNEPVNTRAAPATSSGRARNKAANFGMKDMTSRIAAQANAI